MMNINLQLVPIKLHFALLNGGLAGILPFLPVIGHQLGLTASAIAIIFSGLPFLALLAKPLFGILADKLKCWKILILILICIIITSFFSIHYLPFYTTSLSIPHFKGKFICSQTESFLFLPDSLNKSCLEEYQNLTLECSAYCHNCTLASEVVLPKLNTSNSNEVISSHADSWIPFCQVNDVQFKFLANFKYSNLFVYNFRRYGSSEPIVCEYEIESQCSVNCNVSLAHCFKQVISTHKIYTTSRFWLYTIMLVFGWISVGIVTTLSDAICFEILGDHPEKYGQQRLWGSVGWGAMAVVCGIFINFASVSKNEINYFPAYISMTVLLLLDMLIFFKIQINQPKASGSIMKHIGSILIVPRLFFFIVAVFFIGSFTGFQWTYQFWYLESLGASPLLMGLVIGVEMFVGEIPFFFFSGKIISRIGHYQVLVITFICFFVRYVLYSYLSNPWFVLPIEITQGPTFGLFYATMASFAKMAAPKGLEATMQGLVGGVFEGLGVAVGTLLGGMVFEYYGGRIAFRSAGVIALICGIFFYILKWLFNEPNHMSSEQKESMSRIKQMKIKEQPESHLLIDSNCSKPSLIQVGDSKQRKGPNTFL